ncbi:TPA: TldD/PmbA family protein [Candidatus Micrarchaeota archaeon]|nr:TldD/PmbA family protein [Candidatus Micrarchaeota archaeon]
MPDSARLAGRDRFSPESKFSFAEKSKYPKLDTVDKKVAGMDAAELKAVLDQVRDGAEKYSPLSRVILSVEKEDTSLENTRGLECSSERTEMSAYAEVMDGNGSGFEQYASNSLIKDPVEMGASAAEMAKAMRHPGKPPPGEHTVVAEPETLSSLLDVLLPSFSGDWERRKISKLCGKRGKKMFSKSFSLADDGLHPGLGARPFDDEGVPSRKRPLVQKGVVKRFTYDRETAALAKKKTDGHCNRTHYSMPPVSGVSNLVVPPGTHTNLVDELKSCIVVHSAHGSHTANVTTGDFGLEVTIAFLKKGKKMLPVRGFMLVGNVFDLFNSIEAIEKKQETYGSLITPRIAFRGLRVV